jgi:site-specific recombinase XerD
MPSGGAIVATPPEGDSPLEGSAAAYAAAEKSERTRREYRSSVAKFVAWCEGVGAAAFPASPETVAAHLASLADRGLSVSSIEGRAAAIAYVHKLAREPNPLADERVKAVLRGIRRTIGRPVRGKAAATAKIVTAFLKHAPITMIGKRDRALLLLGFAAALRRSELVALDVSDIERVDGGVIVHIGRSKTDQEGRGHQVAIPYGKKLLVIESLDDWLKAAAISAGPLFRAVTKSGAIGASRLNGRTVARIIKAFAKRAKLDPAAFSGHSMRSGFITSALEAGSDLLRIMDVSRHREIGSLKKYDRRASFENAAGKKFL